jgi:hypothetical protein
MRADATDPVMICTDHRSVVEYAATSPVLPVRLHGRYFTNVEKKFTQG